ncbi:MAG: hypothetical protein RMN25_13815, partial [Anaerolineae bacterium]|nr:hypothetical protein [Thermoflexales bacterium]MDW8408849.1 hypothetical protein [Anaerolineae bacterium]
LPADVLIAFPLHMEGYANTGIDESHNEQSGDHSSGHIFYHLVILGVLHSSLHLLSLVFIDLHDLPNDKSLHVWQPNDVTYDTAQPTGRGLS